MAEGNVNDPIGGGDAFIVSGRVKWFNPTQGLGFIVSEQCTGDVLVHYSVLREHGRRSLREGALVECLVDRSDRGLQARQIISIDFTEALPRPIRSATAAAERDDRPALTATAGGFEPVVVKSFNRTKGFGFLNRTSDHSEDIFIHMETVRLSGLADLQPEVSLEARIADGRRGLTAVEIR